MTRTQQIVQQLARVSGNLSIHEGVATLESGEQINFSEALAGSENDQYYREEARQQYQRDGEIEVDPDALVSNSDGGAYIEAWVWVDSPLTYCECGRDLDDCATAEGAKFCMNRDEYVLFDCPRNYEEYLVAIEAEKETPHGNQ